MTDFETLPPARTTAIDRHDHSAEKRLLTRAADRTDTLDGATVRISVEHNVCGKPARKPAARLHGSTGVSPALDVSVTPDHPRRFRSWETQPGSKEAAA
ncbi:hypothetical protein [Nocardia sp. NPDC127526]|uniref:hypothetical protein n=1 Tax=Nocardia sp. NPDC127526 TaxID=3345393 RepID=UPI0036452CE4